MKTTLREETTHDNKGITRDTCRLCGSNDSTVLFFKEALPNHIGKCV